jgi:simple sugar transport system permease protein
LALLAAAIYWVLLHRTPLGYEIRAVGLNALAAQAASIRVPRLILLAVCSGGAFAGLIAINELFGAQHRLTADLTAGRVLLGSRLPCLAAVIQLGSCLPPCCSAR